MHFKHVFLDFQQYFFIYNPTIINVYGAKIKISVNGIVAIIADEAIFPVNNDAYKNKYNDAKMEIMNINTYDNT